VEPVTGVGARVQLMHARDQPSVVLDWERPQRALSWAIYNGGLTQACSLAICQVRNADLPETVDPTALLRERTTALGRSTAIGLLTSADITRAGVELAEVCGARAGALATVGLGNALRVGDAPTAARAGTINIACWVDVPLSAEALLEAMSIVVAARTMVVLEAGVQSTVSDGGATGTGTDCVVMTCPWSNDPAAQRYAGMHTSIGSAIGRAVSGAVAASLSRCTKRGQARA
jgi:adenosylcobinamide amidohydrolase